MRERIGKASLGAMGKSKQNKEEGAAWGALCAGTFSHDLIVVVSFQNLDHI